MGLSDSVNKSSTSDYPEYWDPASAGDEIIGVVAKISRYDGPGGDGEPCPVLALVEDSDPSIPKDEVRAIRAYQSRLKPLGDTAEVGDLIVLEYEGEEETDNGFKMKTYASAEIPPEKWEEWDEGEEIRDILESCRYYKGAALSSSGADSLSDAVKDAAGGTTSTSPSPEPDNDGAITEDVRDAVADVVGMQDDPVDLDLLDTHLNKSRGYGVDAATAAEMAGFDVENGEVS